MVGKAKVACDLIREVVRTNGKCLHNQDSLVAQL
jgi:hypothetical protein